MQELYKWSAIDMLREVRIFENVCDWVGNARLCYLAKMFIIRLREQRRKERKKYDYIDGSNLGAGA